VLVAWEEAAPARKDTLVRGVRVRSKKDNSALDLYFGPTNQLLTDAEVHALGIAPKDWTPQVVSVDSEPGPSETTAKALPQPRPLSAASVPSLPTVKLPAPDLEKARQEDAQGVAGLAKGVRRIGLVQNLDTPVVVTETAVSTGAWEALPDGRRIWAAVFSAPGALGQRFHLSEVALPAEAQLLAYNADAPEERYSVDVADLGEGWSPTCFSERVAIEIVAPAGAVVRLTMDRAVYIYAGPSEWNWEKAAGSCNVDVSCYSAWADLSRGVGGLGTVNNNGYLWCTGTLLADQNPNTSIPYFLTANHCVANQTEAGSLEIYWLYQTSGCGGSPPSPRTVPRTTGGADYLAGAPFNSGNDFALLRLRGTLPAGLTFVGWETAATSGGADAVCIHHPDGDYKRISMGNTNQSVPPTFGIPSERYYGVYWYLGVTEPGSSGSPLFDASTQRLIGQLWGGTSACALPNDPDVYGRFDKTYPVVKSYLGPVISVTQPNGGEFWQRGMPHEIRWTSTVESGTVRIELLRGGVLQSTLATSAPDTGVFAWTVPTDILESFEYRIRITSNVDSSAFDVSNNDFTLADSQAITVLSPNGGESWTAGSRQTITWNAPGVPGTVRIELLKDSAIVTTVATSATNTGSFSWLVPATLDAGGGYSIRITSNSLGSILDSSNSPFSIVVEPTLTVLSPDGGESWARGKTRTITWTSTNIGSVPVTIELLRDSLPNQTVLVIASAAPNNGSFSWTVPTTLPTASDYRIRISPIQSAAHTDTSDSVFWIGDCAPLAPGTVNASDGTFADHVRVTWSATANTSQYRVYRATSNQFAQASLAGDWQTATVFNDYTAAASTGGCSGGAASGTVYYYWVKPRNSCDEGPVSASDSGYRGSGGARSLETPQTAGLGDTLVLASAMAALVAAGRLQARRKRTSKGISS
ncbi:MAG: Ser-Thr-rich GPI-anchored membrane family protein, partial [FCB group bacterium]|jgi:hypothetical protein|nr:Ser-Thr-rich GPI-anchored membrane family protein [FCB group bacterium]